MKKNCYLQEEVKDGCLSKLRDSLCFCDKSVKDSSFKEFIELDSQNASTELLTLEIGNMYTSYKPIIASGRFANTVILL